jgi:hypothetical protein
LRKACSLAECFELRAKRLRRATYHAVFILPFSSSLTPQDIRDICYAARLFTKCATIPPATE